MLLVYLNTGSERYEQEFPDYEALRIFMETNQDHQIEGITDLNAQDSGKSRTLF